MKRNENDRHQNDVTNIVFFSLLITFNIFTPFSSVSIVNFELVNICWKIDGTQYITKVVISKNS